MADLVDIVLLKLSHLSQAACNIVSKLCFCKHKSSQQQLNKSHIAMNVLKAGEARGCKHTKILSWKSVADPGTTCQRDNPR